MPPSRIALVLFCCLSASAMSADIFNTGREVSPSPAYPLYQGSDATPCSNGAVPTPLPLFEAIARALCQSPKTRTAWAAVRAAAAGVGEAKSAYLPTVELTGLYGRDHDKTTVDGPRELGSNYTQNENGETLQLAWVLYDFGGREATLRNSRAMLLMAQANQNVILQGALATTARDYYAAQAAAAKVESTRRVETGAQKSLDAATARYNTGVAPITDKLQANTAYAQAVYDRASAEGAYRTALGTLAVDMSLPPDVPLTMPGLDQGALPDTTFVRAVHELIDEATRNHPSVVAANAAWQAALANADLTKAQGRPKISLAGSLSHSDQPLNANIGTLTYPSHTFANSIGVNIDIPLFSGFSQEYKIRQAEALADEQEQALRDAKQQVSIGVWSGVQTLETDTENLKNTDVIVESARAAFQAAQQRYGSGVGNILELLNSQATLAGAEQLYIQAQLEWRAARLGLAASLGNLGTWALK